MKIDKIIRSDRKTIAIQIKDDATLIVKAPFGVSEDIIQKVVIKHKNWIERRIKEILERDPKTLNKEFVNGEGFLYLGRYYKLYIVDKQDISLVFNNGFYLSKDYLPKAREIFINWYKKKAFDKISERVEIYAKKRGFIYSKIRISDAKTRWASCSSKGTLSFSWRLIMAPLSVIDYVVIHELVHLEEKNHKRNFWIKVKMLMPDYEKYKDWLKQNGYLLKL
ncbi:M48 family metallopeptidase [Thermotoga profunda]|uniref:M48 family metallopeptidase n=1 Tax=Thermotoga profunda TaxID=1508420 RepID=UPI000597ADF3|nr:SprT family zinc-dependent metalloprotease [Thermotoga profunda]